MGFLNDILGTKNKFQATPIDLQMPVSNELAQTAIGQTQGGLKQQQDFANALNAQGGIGNQAGVFAQQQALAHQLGQQAQGQGPNPALAQLNQSTGQNVANQAALMAGQRGSGANAGLLARQAALQGGNLQQQAAGQGAVLQAQQQLAAQQALQQQQAQMANLASQQVGQQANAIQGYNQTSQGNQGQLLGAIGNQNTAKTQAELGTQALNADVAKQNSEMQAKLSGGVLGQAGNILNVAKDVGGGLWDAAKWLGSGLVGGIGALGEGVMTAGEAIGPGAAVLLAAKGGEVPQPKSYVGKHFHSMKQGGRVAGKASVKGDSLKNDTVPAMLSPGEVVIPRHVMQSKDPSAGAAEFVRQVMAKKGMKK